MSRITLWKLQYWFFEFANFFFSWHWQTHIMHTVIPQYCPHFANHAFIFCPKPCDSWGVVQWRISTLPFAASRLSCNHVAGKFLQYLWITVFLYIYKKGPFSAIKLIVLRNIYMCVWVYAGESLLKMQTKFFLWNTRQ